MSLKWILSTAIAITMSFQAFANTDSLVGKTAYFQSVKGKKWGRRTPGEYSHGAVISDLGDQVVVRTSKEDHLLKREEIFITEGCLEDYDYCVGDQVISDWLSYRPIDYAASPRNQVLQGEVIGVQKSIAFNRAWGLLPGKVLPRLLLKKRTRRIIPGNEGEVDPDHENYEPSKVVVDEFVWTTKPGLEGVYREVGELHYQNMVFQIGDRLAQKDSGVIAGEVVGFHDGSEPLIKINGESALPLLKDSSYIAVKRKNKNGSESFYRIPWIDYEKYYKL